MLDRIVWFVRLESEPMTMAPLVLGDLLDQARTTAATTLDELAGAAGLGDLAEPVPVDLDPTNATAAVTGDRDLLVWALAELLVNARKFGGPDVRVAVAATPAGPWVSVRVTSVGTVIDPALAEDAFRLGRLLQPRGERPGIGMGLPLCRRIVTRHGGRVVARAEAGVGTTIELLLLGSGPSDVG
jgi:signal transduction histidine kinase